VIFLNSTLIGYMTELGLEDKIVGVSSPEYIFSEKVQQLIKAGKIQNVGSEQKYDIEKILALKPDAVFTNYIASFENTYELLKKNGIKIIFLMNTWNKSLWKRVPT
jgi:iron complex transport system substrate-binding protein